MSNIKKMTPTEQRKMLSALNKAADYTKQGMTPDEALTKVAKERDLSAPKIERLCEAYNKANAVAYMKSAPESERAENYPIAKIANVTKNIFGIKEKVAEELEIKPRNYAAEGFIMEENDKPLDKVASEEKGCNKIHPKSVARSIEILRGQMEKMSRQADDARIKAERAVRNGLQAITEEIQKIPVDMKGKKRLEKIASNMVNAFGTTTGHMIINAVNANIDDPTRYMGCLEKTANAVVLPEERIYKLAKKLVKDREHMVEKQAALSAAEEIQQNAADLMVHNPLIANLKGLPALVRAPESPHMDPSTGMTGEWDAYAKDLDSRRLLYDLMLNDEEISSYSPRKVQETYNDIVETFPELSKRRKILRAILRKSLAQGGNMDIYEIKDLIGAGRDRISAQGASASQRKDINQALSMSGDNNASSDIISQNVPIQIGATG